MAKLRKQQRGDPESAKSSRSDVRNTDSGGSRALPVIHERSAFETQRLRLAANYERPRSDNPVRNVVQERERLDSSKSDRAKSKSPTSQRVKTEPRAAPIAQKSPSPLRISQKAAADSEMVASGPSKSEPGYRREQCGTSCQKCGRPRRPFVPEATKDEITPAPPANWPLPGPSNKDAPRTGDSAIKDENVPEARQQEPTAIPSTEQQAKRRKYFSLPTKPKPSFKGPTELASVKDKALEPPSKPGPGGEKQRPVSAPSPTKGSFKEPADIRSPTPQPKGTVHVRFATDEPLGRFAGIIKAQEASSARIQALRSLTPGPAAKSGSHVPGNAMWTPRPSKPQQVPQPHRRAWMAAKPTARANSAILHEWPLVTSFINLPASNPSTRQPGLKSTPNRSSLSISKRPSRQTVRPYSNPHVNGPLPNRRTSSRYKPLLQQSRKVSYIMDHASNGSNDSVSIQILDMLQGFPGGELAATANTKPDHKPLSERPSLLRPQTYQPDGATENFALNGHAPDEELTCSVYSPSDQSSEEDDDDDQPMPVTPPQSDFSPASYSIGDDRHLLLKKPSELVLPPASRSGPSSASGESELASAESPPSAPSTSQPPAHPHALTPSPDSEGMIPVNSLLSVVDLPEVISSEEENEMDPDWLSWGALPGSYGCSGLWSGASSPGLENGGPVELGVAS